MSRKNKIDPVRKVEMVEKYLMGEASLREAAKQAAYLSQEQRRSRDGSTSIEMKALPD